MKKVIALSVLLAAASFGALAQTTCNPEDKSSDCSVEQAFDFYRGEVTTLTVSKVVNSNRATTPPDAFSGRVHNSYQDFLNLLSFAVNDVKQSSNGDAIVVRFNPLRSGNNLLGLTLTVAKPTVAEAVKNAIPEASRDTTVPLLEKQLGDTDDRTWAASYSYASSSCQPDRDPDAKCWGRKPQIYMDLLGLMLPTTIRDPRLADSVEELVNFFDEVDVNVFELKLSKAGANRDAAIAKIKEIVGFEKASADPARALFKARHFDLFATLIDNQPQITGSASYRDPGRLGGPKERAATLEFHAGRDNINTLRQACRAKDDDRGTCMQQRLNQLAADGLSTDKYVATFTYKKTHPYVLADLGLKDPVAGFEGIDLKSSSEYNVKIQGGRQLGTEVMGKATRADFSFEGIRTDNDGTRTKNRWVGTLTLSVPFGDNITVPVSLTYANKAEFLGDPKERFGAHFGLSYRLPDLFKSQN